MTGFFEVYVRAFAIALPVWAAAILVIGAVKARLCGARIGIAVAVASTLFGGWYAAAVPLAQRDVFNVPPTLGDPPVILGFLLGGTAVVWALAVLTPLGCRITRATPLSVIAAFQVPRIMGAVFLIGWLAGRIPIEFALPAGLGDIWAGIAGYQASRALTVGAPDAYRRLVWANFIGIGDIVMAVSLGIMTSTGFAHVLSQDAPNIINDYPLALFPAYFVPIFLGFHLISISLMRAERKGRTPDPEVNSAS